MIRNNKVTVPPLPHVTKPYWQHKQFLDINFERKKTIIILKIKKSMTNLGSAAAPRDLPQSWAAT